MKRGKTLLATAGWMAFNGLSVTVRAQQATPALPARPPATTRIFPLAEVHRGLQGVAYTVFEGVMPEPMQVEILGVLKNSLGPGKDMILARLHGSRPEYTGVVAGMSGSPVYIDGRLAGALSFRVGQFSKEPIAGITPIEQMFEVRDQLKTSNIAMASRSGLDQPVHNPPDGGRTLAGPGPITPIETPIVFGGFSQEAIARFGDRFRKIGMEPVAGLGGSDSKASQPEPLIPGSAVSAILVRGDLSMAGTCTVTYVDRERLLACGHPITQYGPVELPMAKADVLATLPSPLNAFKIVNTTETVGTFVEDRSSALLGRFGQQARMIPVEVNLTYPGTPRPAHTTHFEVVNNRELTPSAILVSVYQTLRDSNAAASEMTYRLSGQLGVKGEPSVRLSGLLSEDDLNPGAIRTAMYVNDVFGKVYGDSIETPELTGLRLNIEAIDGRRTGVIESARIDPTEVRPGDTVEVEAVLQPFQDKEQRIRIPVRIPDAVSPGTLRILVSDAANADKVRSATGGTDRRPAGVSDTVAELNRSHPNNGIYVTLLEHEAQAAVTGTTMAAMPLSVANVLNAGSDAHELQLTGESAILAGSIMTDLSVSGAHVIDITIR